MARRILNYCVLAGCIIGLAGCGFYERPQRAAWRGQAERTCLKQGSVKASASLIPRSAINAGGLCGLDHPFRVTALANGSVSLKSRATLGCPMIATLDRWIADVVQPAAMARFGQPITEISTMGSYGCRRRNHRRGAKWSEHAFGNALDIGGFKLADGRTLKVVQHWRRGEHQERAFLRHVHAGACRDFRTVLGPGSDRYHENHFHFDLAIHGKSSRGLRHYCRPVIKDIAPPPQLDRLPDPPLLTPDQEIARRHGRRPVLALSQPRERNLGRMIGRLPDQQFGHRIVPPMNILQPMQGERAGRTYGRLRALEPGAQLVYDPRPTELRPTNLKPALRSGGTIRTDGVYVPPER